MSTSWTSFRKRFGKHSQDSGTAGRPGAEGASAPDEIVLTEIYAASEAPIPGVTVEALAEAVNRRRATPVTVVKSLDAIPAAVADLARAGDLVITLGAGSIGSVPAALMRELERRHAPEVRS